MSRAGYCDDYDMDNWNLIRWRGQVASAIKGRRGQAFLRELIEALDALPEKKLIANDLENCGNVCAIGSVGLKRGVDMSALDPQDAEPIAATFGIASQMVREIEWMNDECFYASPEIRWREMRAWAVSQLRPAKQEATDNA